MAVRRRQTVYWLALGGAVAAHALLLSLPWPALPSHPPGTDTLAIQLPPRPANRTPRNGATPKSPSTKAPAPIKAQPIKRVRRQAPAAPSTPAVAVNKPRVETHAKSKTAPVSKSGRGAPARQARVARSDRPPGTRKAHRPLKVVKPLRLSSAAPEPPKIHPKPVRASVAGLHRPRSGTGAPPAAQTGAKRHRYQERLVAYLARFRRYPLLAQREGQQGMVAVHFVMNRQGHILSDRLVTRTPYPLLNQEALAMLQRAQPLPPPPSGLAGKTLAWTLPIQFELP